MIAKIKETICISCGNTLFFRQKQNVSNVGIEVKQLSLQGLKIISMGRK